MKIKELWEVDLNCWKIRRFGFVTFWYNRLTEKYIYKPTWGQTKRWRGTYDMFLGATDQEFVKQSDAVEWLIKPDTE